MSAPLPPGRVRAAGTQVARPTTRPCTCNAWRVVGLEHEPGCAQIVRPIEDRRPAPSAGQDTGQALRDEIADVIGRHLPVYGGPDSIGCSASCVAEWEPDHVTLALLDGPLRQLIDQRDQARAQVRREVLDEVWAAIHVQRYDVERGNRTAPDSFYAGVVRARITVDNLRRALDGLA